MLDFSNVTENLFGAIIFLRLEHLSHMVEDSSELCDMFGQGTNLLIGVSHDVCRLVKFLRHRCAKGNEADNTSGYLGHCARSLVMNKEILVMFIPIKYLKRTQRREALSDLRAGSDY